jgi:hypothetical protein
LLALTPATTAAHAGPFLGNVGSVPSAAFYAASNLTLRALSSTFEANSVLSAA